MVKLDGEYYTKVNKLRETYDPSGAVTLRRLNTVKNWVKAVGKGTVGAAGGSCDALKETLTTAWDIGKFGTSVVVVVNGEIFRTNSPEWAKANVDNGVKTIKDGAAGAWTLVKNPKAAYDGVVQVINEKGVCYVIGYGGTILFVGKGVQFGKSALKIAVKENIPKVSRTFRLVDGSLGEAVQMRKVKQLEKMLEDITKNGVTSAKQLKKLGVKSVEELIKWGVDSADDLKKLGITSIKELKKYGIKNADDLAKLGINSAEELKKIGITTPEQLKKLGITSAEDLKKLGVKIENGKLKKIEGGSNPLISIDEIRPQLKTEPDTAFFWSGRTDGVGGADTAANIAKNRGGVTLESTIEAKNIQMPEWDFNDPSTMEAWDLASGAYAEQVSGEIRAVVGNELREGNIWENVELPRLMDNPNVTKITTIDPKTGIERIIFER